MSSTNHPLFTQTQPSQTVYSQPDSSSNLKFRRSSSSYKVSQSPRPSMDQKISLVRQRRGFFSEIVILSIILFLAILAILQILLDLNLLTAWPWSSCTNGSTIVTPVSLNLTICASVSFNKTEAAAFYCTSHTSLYLNSSNGSFSLLSSSELLLNASYSTACQLDAPWNELPPALLLQFVALLLHAFFLLELLFRACCARCRCSSCDALEITDALVVILCCALACVASALAAFVFIGQPASLVRDACNLLPLLRLMRLLRVMRTQRDLVNALQDNETLLQDEREARLRAEEKLRSLERDRVTARAPLPQQQKVARPPAQSSVAGPGPGLRQPAERRPSQIAISVAAPVMSTSTSTRTGGPSISLQVVSHPALSNSLSAPQVLNLPGQKRSPPQTVVDSSPISSSQGPTPSSSASKSANLSGGSVTSVRPLIPVESSPTDVSPVSEFTAPLRAMEALPPYRPIIDGSANSAYSPAKELVQAAFRDGTAVEMRALPLTTSSGIEQRPQQSQANGAAIAAPQVLLKNTSTPQSVLDAKSRRQSTLRVTQEQALSVLDAILSEHSSAADDSPNRSRTTSAAEAIAFAELDGVLAAHRSSSPTPSETEAEAFRALDEAVLAHEDLMEDDKRTGGVRSGSALGNGEADAVAGSASSQEEQRRPHANASRSHSRHDARSGAARAIDRVESHTRKSGASASPDHLQTRRPANKHSPS